MAALFLDLLDMTVTNVALSAFERAFGGTPSTLQWMTTIYLLTMAIVTPAIGNRFGSKRAFLVALFLLTGRPRSARRLGISRVGSPFVHCKVQATDS